MQHFLTETQSQPYLVRPLSGRSSTHLLKNTPSHLAFSLSGLGNWSFVFLTMGSEFKTPAGSPGAGQRGCRQRGLRRQATAAPPPAEPRRCTPTCSSQVPAGGRGGRPREMLGLQSRGEALVTSGITGKVQNLFLLKIRNKICFLPKKFKN